MKTVLNDRTLWYDGTSEVEPEQVPELLLTGMDPSQIVVTKLNDDIRQFNQLVDAPIPVGKHMNRPLDMAWQVPAEYLKINLPEVLRVALTRKNLTSPEYASRVDAELREIEIRGMGPLIKTMIYVVDRFNSAGQVWGVGRGSSCASLVLFLIGLHKVDPIKYGIPMEEFFH